MRRCYRKSLTAFAYQNHHVGRRSATCQQFLHVVEHIRDDLCLHIHFLACFVLGRNSFEAHISAFLPVRLIVGRQFRTFEALVVYLLNQFLLVEIGVFCQFGVVIHHVLEERQVEVHHGFAASEILLQRRETLVDTLPCSADGFFRQFRHDMPVSVSPTVNRLLDVTHDKQSVAFRRQHIHQQLTNDAPLQLARVLKLVHQHVMIADTCFLQNKIRIPLTQSVT